MATPKGWSRQPLNGEGPKAPLFTCRLFLGQRERLAAAARARGVTSAQLVREFIDTLPES